MMKHSLNLSSDVDMNPNLCCEGHTVRGGLFVHFSWHFFFMAGLIDGWMDWLIVRSIDGWMDGWVRGWVGGCVGGVCRFFSDGTARILKRLILGGYYYDISWCIRHFCV